MWMPFVKSCLYSAADFAHFRHVCIDPNGKDITHIVPVWACSNVIPSICIGKTLAQIFISTACPCCRFHFFFFFAMQRVNFTARSACITHGELQAEKPYMWTHPMWKNKGLHYDLYLFKSYVCISLFQFHSPKMLFAGFYPPISILVTHECFDPVPQ